MPDFFTVTIRRSVSKPPRYLRSAVMLAAFVLTSSAFAQAMPRIVIVNGKIMNRAELSILDTANCSTPVPNGRYWLNINTGAWGFQGGPQQGFIGSQCRAAGRAPAQNGRSGCPYRSWEDRMANCYGRPFRGDVTLYQNPIYQ